MTVVDTWDSLMVIVPHQDDEILMTAGVIRHCVNAGIPVDVVMATNGDCGCRDFSAGWARLRESIKGLEVLGLMEERLHVLGYADTGMPAADSFLTHLYGEEDEEKIYSSSCSGCTYGLPEKPEFHMERHGSHAVYSRANFRKDLKEIIREKKPAVIITTSEWDMHGDHSGLYHFVCEVLKELREESGQGGAKPYQPQLYTGLVHSPAGDESWPARRSPLFDCPEGLEEQTSLKWGERITVPVPEEMLFRNGEENLKLRSLLQYETALEPGAYDFLMAFVKEEEIFWRAAWI